MKRQEHHALRTTGGEDKLLREMERRCRKLSVVFISTQDGWLIAQRGSTEIASEQLAGEAAVALSRARHCCQTLAASTPDVLAVMTEIGYLVIRELGGGLLLCALNDTPDGDVVSIMSALDVSPLLT